MSEGRQEKPGIWLWVTVAGAVLALPVAVFTTCQVRGKYTPAPEDPPLELLGRSLTYDATSLGLGLAAGILLALALACVARTLRRRKPPPPGE